MTLGSDQNLDSAGLSHTSQRMLELRDAMFAEWEKRVRASMKESAKLSRPVLMDTLPIFYDNIAEAVTPGYARVIATDGTSIASAHGNERARLSDYDTDTLISEYQIFRRTIYDVLYQHGTVPTNVESLIINASIEAGIREAVGAFSLAQFTLQQHFVAALAHDLRNPLSTANMALELILKSSDPAYMKTIAVKAVDNLNRMDQMIQQLLGSMAFQAGERMQLDYTHFDIAEVIKEVQVQAGATHGIRFQVFGGSVKGWWDHSAIKRVMENLVGNALKYGDMNAPIRVSYTEVYERLVLMVHNQGQPIPPEEQDDIFHIFKRAQAAKQGKSNGWGIGLPFVRVVAGSHGGTVTVDSTLERGTTFTLDIPLDSRPFQNAPALP